jgi:hypothetical protein
VALDTVVQGAVEWVWGTNAGWYNMTVSTALTFEQSSLKPAQPSDLDLRLRFLFLFLRSLLNRCARAIDGGSAEGIT